MRPFIDVLTYASPRAGFAPAFADYIEDVVLATDTLVRVPIPANATYAVFSFDADFRAKLGKFDTTLALPAATSADGSGSELSPAARSLPAKLGDGAAATHICLRAPAACKGSIAFYGN